MRTQIVDLERKRRFLEVATEMAWEDVAGEPAFGHLASLVRISTVAERLRISRTALYRLWPTQHDYRVDLAAYVALQSSASPWVTDTLARLEETLDPTHPDLLEACRRDANVRQPDLASDPMLALRAASLGYPAPNLIATARAAVERQAHWRATRHLDAALRAVGHRPVVPLTVLDLTLMIGFMVDGIAGFARRLPDVVATDLMLDGEADRPWSLLAYAIRCLLAELTEPASAAAADSAGESSGRDDEAAPPDDIDAGPQWTPAQRQALAAGAAELGALVPGAVEASDGAVAEITALGHVTLDRVARRAGVSRRHLYNVWDSQSAFRADLMSHIGEHGSEEYFGSFDDATLEAIAGATEPAEIALAICEQINRHRHDGSLPAPAPFSAFYPLLGDPEIQRRQRVSLERLLHEQDERLRALEALLGVTLRDGLSVRDVTVLLLAAAGGSERLHRIVPDAIRTELPYRGGRWSAFSIACTALVTHSTTPAPAPVGEEISGGRAGPSP